MPWHPKNESNLKGEHISIFSSICVFSLFVWSFDISSWGFGVPYQYMKCNSRSLLEDVNSLKSNYQRDCPSSLCSAAAMGTGTDDPSRSLSTEGILFVISPTEFYSLPSELQSPIPSLLHGGTWLAVGFTGLQIRNCTQNLFECPSVPWWWKSGSFVVLIDDETSNVSCTVSTAVKV